MEGGHETSMNVEGAGTEPRGNERGAARPWSSTQAYGLSIVCLVLGLALGYLFHGPNRAGNATPEVSKAHEQHQHGSVTSVTPEQLKHMADKTVEPFLEKLKQSPNDPKLLYGVGNAYYAAHQFDMAIEYYSKAADLDPDAKVLTQLSNAYHYAGSDEKALATLDRALQVDPKFANALFNLGMLKWQAQGDKVAAIAAWKKLLKTNPKHPNRRQVQMMIERVQQS